MPFVAMSPLSLESGPTSLCPSHHGPKWWLNW